MARIVLHDHGHGHASRSKSFTLTWALSSRYYLCFDTQQSFYHGHLTQRTLNTVGSLQVLVRDTNIGHDHWKPALSVTLSWRRPWTSPAARSWKVRPCPWPEWDGWSRTGWGRGGSADGLTPSSWRHQLVRKTACPAPRQIASSPPANTRFVTRRLELQWSNVSNPDPELYELSEANK